MAVIYKNALLSDCFASVPGVTAASRPEDVRSIVGPYEAGKVIVLPDLKPQIDFGFWSSLKSEDWRGFRKLKLRGEEAAIDRALLDQAPDRGVLEEVQRQVQDLYRQLLPVYYALFRPYRFKSRMAIARLNTIMNDDMHFDTYDVMYEDHFARMFVNLDDQPRIWHASWTVQEIHERFGDRITPEEYASLSDKDLWAELRWRTFRNAAGDKWWDGHPRHVMFFQPGDVWLVDSRQTAHQIFYGRRAISIDFAVDVASMQDPGRYYGNIVAEFRKKSLEGSSIQS